MNQQTQNTNYVYFERGTKSEKEFILNSNSIDNDDNRFVQIKEKIEDNSCVIL